MMSEKPVLAFFGATGGCVLACLVLALEAGYRCIALVRDPSKLQNLLRSRGVPESTVADNCFMITGSVTDLQVVQQTLLHQGRSVDIIISGIGGQMRFESLLSPTLDNPTICQDAMRTILTAARLLASKPVLVVVSTTGISRGKRDLPILMLPMYHWMLRVPHEDKKAMESLILEEMSKPERERGIRDYVLVRPSLLYDGEGNGLDKIREGTEKSPSVGYVITRMEVGMWLFTKTVRSYGRDDSHLGEIFTITT